MTPAEPLSFDIRIPDFAVSWAGANPHGQSGFCFGSEDGRVVFTDKIGKPKRKPFVASPSGEAVNGIAGVKDGLSVSTRAELVVLTPHKSGQTLRVTLHHGAHGVIVSDRRFIAPCGRYGFALINPRATTDKWRLVSPDDLGDALCITSVVSLPKHRSNTLVAVSLRRQGVGLFDANEVASGTSLLTNATLLGLDFIDVCRVSDSHTAGFAALSRDGAIVVWQTCKLSGTHRQFRARAVVGVAYRLLSCRGHFVILTSSAVYVLLNITKELFRVSSEFSIASKLYMSILEGVDMNLAENRYLLVVLADDSVRVFDLLAIEAAREAGTLELTDALPEPFEPQWVESSYRHTARQLQPS